MVLLVVHPDNPELRVDSDECMHSILLKQTWGDYGILTGSELNAANSHVLIVKKEFTDSVGDPSRILKESTSPGLARIAIQNLVREACDDVLNDLLGGLTALVLIGDDHRVCLRKAHCLRLTQLYLPGCMRLVFQSCPCQKVDYRSARISLQC